MKLGSDKRMMITVKIPSTPPSSLRCKVKTFFILAILALAACQTGGKSLPAVLYDTKPASVEALRIALAKALNKNNVELGPSNLSSSTISVLPPRPSIHEGRSLVIPIIFDLAIQGPNCVAIRRDTNEIYKLKGVSCRQIPD